MFDNLFGMLVGGIRHQLQRFWGESAQKFLTINISFPLFILKVLRFVSQKQKASISVFRLPNQYAVGGQLRENNNISCLRRNIFEGWVKFWIWV